MQFGRVGARGAFLDRKHIAVVGDRECPSAVAGRQSRLRLLHEVLIIVRSRQDMNLGGSAAGAALLDREHVTVRRDAEIPVLIGRGQCSPGLHRKRLIPAGRRQNMYLGLAATGTTGLDREQIAIARQQKTVVGIGRRQYCPGLQHEGAIGSRRRLGIDAQCATDQFDLVLARNLAIRRAAGDFQRRQLPAERPRRSRIAASRTDRHVFLLENFLQRCLRRRAERRANAAADDHAADHQRRRGRKARAHQRRSRHCRRQCTGRTQARHSRHARSTRGRQRWTTRICCGPRRHRRDNHGAHDDRYRHHRIPIGDPVLLIQKDRRPDGEPHCPGVARERLSRLDHVKIKRTDLAQTDLQWPNGFVLDAEAWCKHVVPL